MAQLGRGTRLLVAALLPLAAAGCADFWDQVTSRNFEMQQLFVQPNPFTVLQDSTDGDQRARALRALREPKQYGAGEQDQEAVLRILTTAATSEKQALCRLAAIESLGRFHDPRAVTALTEAFYNSGTYPPEMATRIQCQAVGALAETANATAVPFLVKVARGAPADGTDQEKQQVLDVRIAASRALGSFTEAQAVEALVAILRSEKDVALCDCAFESLQHCTGRKLPPDFHDWDAILKVAHGQPDALPEPSLGARVGEWISQVPTWNGIW